MAIGSRDQPMVLDSEEEGNGVDVSSYSYAPRKRVKVEKVKKEDVLSEGREDIRDQLLKLDTEIDDVKAQLEPLHALLVSLKSERSELERRLHTSAHSTSHPSSASFPSSSTSRSQAATMINYQQDAFPWSDQLKAMAKRTFGISKFRLCQEGVINAAMDGRDIVCVMPTGGGKSLTYQLPAIMGKGVTVVISPLLALIWDQCRALTEVGVKCVMLTGNVSQSDQSRIMRELEDGADDPSRDIRLCYVTPEKVSKSKRFIASLQKLYSAGRLKRFVIDEAHCCSQLGHDYRPDYKELAKLKSLFPRTPIQAVTATLSSKTLPDLRRILQLPECVNAERAPPPTARVGTVFFTAPLYRPNLHYKVINKPSSSKASIEAIVNWITANRPGESGIIYCLSKKDTEEVADAVRLASKGAIKTGVYHAAIDDGEKERIHIQWRQGIVNCICATIAFGLGIDKGDVRYVIHHSLSKSLDGYYQETGRAGRDGQDSDCVLFFRPQDSTRLSAVMTGVPSETEKLREMILYAQNVKTCRKVLFAKYFSTSAQLSANAWDNAADLTADGTGAGGNITTCGSCDNCIRDPEALQTRDVTVDAWKMLKVAHYVESNGGRLTAGGLVDLARGLGGGKFAVQQTNKKGRSFNAGEGKLNVAGLIGDKVGMSKDDAETLVLDLILGSYLRELALASHAIAEMKAEWIDYVQTAYSMNVYVQPADKAYRLTRLSRERIESGDALAAPIRCTFVVPVKAARKEKAKTPAKRTKTKVVEISDGDDGENDHAGVDGSEEEDVERDRGSGSSKSVGGSGSSRRGPVKSETTSSSMHSPWTTKVKSGRPTAKKRKVAVTPLKVDDEYDNEFDREVFDVDGVQDEDVEGYPVYGEEAGDAGVGGRGADSRDLGAFADAWSDDEAY